MPSSARLDKTEQKNGKKASRTQEQKTSERNIAELVSLVDSPVNHKGLYQGWRRLSLRDRRLKGPIGQKYALQARVRKRGVVWIIYGVKDGWKGHKDRNRHKNRIKRSGQARLVYVKNTNRNIPTTRRWARRDTWQKAADRLKTCPYDSDFWVMTSSGIHRQILNVRNVLREKGIIIPTVKRKDIPG